MTGDDVSMQYYRVQRAAGPCGFYRIVPRSAVSKLVQRSTHSRFPGPRRRYQEYSRVNHLYMAWSVLSVLAPGGRSHADDARCINI